MLDAIKNFSEQFTYHPKIENKKLFKKYKKFIILGMGGSGLAAELLLNLKPQLPIIIHKDYGLPNNLSIKELKKSLVIANSYSGNTAEVLDGLQLALKNRIPVMTISINGKLIKIAKQKKLPYIQMPNLQIQPRQAIALNLKALLKAVGQDTLLNEMGHIKIASAKEKSTGQKIAQQLQGKVPIIYASANNHNLAYIWKIKFNENTKIPAFYNILPELNHNEMTGFDTNQHSQVLAKNFSFIFLEDSADRPENIQRFKVLKRLYQKKGLKVHTLNLKKSTNLLEKYFTNIVLADWTSYYLALHYQQDPEAVPMVEEFKKML